MDRENPLGGVARAFPWSRHAAPQQSAQTMLCDAQVEIQEVDRLEKKRLSLSARFCSITHMGYARAANAANSVSHLLASASLGTATSVEDATWASMLTECCQGGCFPCHEHVGRSQLCRYVAKKPEAQEDWIRGRSPGERALERASFFFYLGGCV